METATDGKCTIYRVVVGGPTREIGPARPRLEGPSTTQTDIRSLSLGQFLGEGSEGGGRQDLILAEINMMGAHVNVAKNGCT
jgi:hypothetical protein